jgi:phage-related protein (TIGR01555 family)
MDAEIIWRADDIAAKLIEKVPEEMTRQGWTLKIEDDENKEITEAMENWARDLDLIGKAKEALEYSRAYGGAGIFLGADDGQKDLTKPLDVKRIKSFNWMNVLTPLEMFPRIWYGDPHAPKYGEPMIYRIQRFVFGGAVETGFSEKIFEMPLVHESRFIRVDGIRVSRRHLRQRNGWGDSVFMRALQVISDFQQAYAGASILISDFAQAVLKIKNLAELVSANDTATIQARAQLIDMSRSLARAVVIDSEEEFERKATPVSGLPELLEKIREQQARATRPTAQ